MHSAVAIVHTSPEALISRRDGQCPSRRCSVVRFVGEVYALVRIKHVRITLFAGADSWSAAPARSRWIVLLHRSALLFGLTEHGLKLAHVSSRCTACLGRVAIVTALYRGFIEPKRQDVIDNAIFATKELLRNGVRAVRDAKR